MFPPDGGSEGRAEEAEITAPVCCRNEITLWSQEQNSGLLMHKRRDAFPSQLIYSLDINRPNKTSVSCVLHRKEFKMISLQCISHIPTMKSYKTFTRAGKQDRLGSLFR